MLEKPTMAEYIVKDEDLTGLKGKVVIVTGMPTQLLSHATE